MVPLNWHIIHELPLCWTVLSIDREYDGTPDKKLFLVKVGWIVTIYIMFRKSTKPPSPFFRIRLSLLCLCLILKLPLVYKSNTNRKLPIVVSLGLGCRSCICQVSLSRWLLTCLMDRGTRTLHDRRNQTPHERYTTRGTTS